MTGLSETEHRLLEIAFVVTDLDFLVIDEYQQIIFQDETALTKMDAFVANIHTKSGLLGKISSGLKTQEVDSQARAFIDLHFPTTERIVLAGNSVGNDKRFIDVWMPKVAERLHYRIIDVSSFKEIFRSKYGIEFQKKGTHSAHTDIHESIAELKHYLSFVHAPNI